MTFYISLADSIGFNFCINTTRKSEQEILKKVAARDLFSNLKKISGIGLSTLAQVSSLLGISIFVRMERENQSNIQRIKDQYTLLVLNLIQDLIIAEKVESENCSIVLQGPNVVLLDEKQFEGRNVRIVKSVNSCNTAGIKFKENAEFKNFETELDLWLRDPKAKGDKKKAAVLIKKAFQNILTKRNFERFALSLVAEVSGDPLELNLNGLSLNSLPPSIAILTELEALDLSCNKLTVIPQWITALANLKSLNLADNPIEEFSSLPMSLRRLQLSRISWVQIPQAVLALTDLEDLDLTGNKISILSPKFFLLLKLKVLRLNGNQIQVIPDAIGELSVLNHLDLSENQLTSLPSSIGRLTALKCLNLSKNRMDHFPGAMATLTGLENLTISHNRLTFVPDFVRGYKSLSAFNISFNPSLGYFPVGVAFLPHLDYFFYHRTALSFEVAEYVINIRQLAREEPPQNLEQLFPIDMEPNPAKLMRDARILADLMAPAFNPTDIFQVSTVSQARKRALVHLYKLKNSRNGFKVMNFCNSYLSLATALFEKRVEFLQHLQNGTNLFKVPIANYSVYFAKAPAGNQVYVNLGKESLLGKGTYKVVTLGLDLQSMELIALGKTKLGEVGKRTSRKDVARNEANVVLLLPKSNRFVLPTAIGEMRDDKGMRKQYMFMPYCNRGTLHDAIPTLSFEDKCRVGLHVVEGLMLMHQEGIVHQDMKPANVLLHDDGEIQARLSDFGFAKLIKNQVELKTVGTPLFMSPRKLRCYGHSDFPASLAIKEDIWGFGFILYELFINSKTFDELAEKLKPQNFTQMAIAYEEQLLLDRTILTEPIELLILGLMHPDPAQVISLEVAQKVLERILRNTIEPEMNPPKKAKIQKDPQD